MVYLDTSALLKLYVRESGSAAVQQLIESQAFVSVDKRQRKLAIEMGFNAPDLSD